MELRLHQVDLSGDGVAALTTPGSLSMLAFMNFVMCLPSEWSMCNHLSMQAFDG
jgi:hypothetical protein